jgi:hypothetical protein
LFSASSCCVDNHLSVVLSVVNSVLIFFFYLFFHGSLLFYNMCKFCPFYFLVAIFFFFFFFTLIDFVEGSGVVFVVNKDLFYLIFFLLGFGGQLACLHPIVKRYTLCSSVRSSFNATCRTLRGAP